MVTAITTATTTSMAETAAAAALYRLLAWMSPAYPVGAFSYSHGLEWAVETGDITDLKSLVGWLTVVLEEGSGVADATFCAHAHRAVSAGDAAALARWRNWRSPSSPPGNGGWRPRRRAMPSWRQRKPPGRRRRSPSSAAPGTGRWPIPWPSAPATAAHGIAEATAVHAFLHAVAANLISAAVRLVPLGQTDGQRALAALEPVVGATAGVARSLTLDAIGGHALRSDLASMRHETQYTRLFRS